MRSRVRSAYLVARRQLNAVLLEGPAGIETADIANLDALGLEAPGRQRYEPSAWWDLRRIISPREIKPDDVFIDLGSGKGRVVVCAARYPFRRVMGVEVSEELNEVARRNVDAVGTRLRCHDVSLITADLGEFEVPDDVTYVYIYNSLRGELFSTAVDALLRSYDRRPRTLRFIYKTPTEEARLLATGRARRTRKRSGLRPGRGWSAHMSTRMYELGPRVAGEPASVAA